MYIYIRPYLFISCINPNAFSFNRLLRLHVIRYRCFLFIWKKKIPFKPEKMVFVLFEILNLVPKSRLKDLFMSYFNPHDLNLLQNWLKHRFETTFESVFLQIIQSFVNLTDIAEKCTCIYVPTCRHNVDRPLVYVMNKAGYPNLQPIWCIWAWGYVSACWKGPRSFDCFSNVTLVNLLSVNQTCNQFFLWYNIVISSTKFAYEELMTSHTNNVFWIWNQ